MGLQAIWGLAVHLCSPQIISRLMTFELNSQRQSGGPTEIGVTRE